MSNNPYQSPTKSAADGSGVIYQRGRPTVIKSIGVLSAGKIMGFLYAALGLLVGGMFALISLAGVQAAGGQGALPLMFGAGSVIILPIVYGVLGFIGGVIMAVLYNVIAAIVGGIELDLG